MATFNVALLIILIGIGLCVSSVRSDEQQNQNKTENGGGLKHLVGLDGSAFSLISLLSSNSRLGKQIKKAIRENLNALAEKMSGIEAKLEQFENGMRDSQTLLTTKLENGLRENLNALAEKMSGIEAKLEKQIENGKCGNQNGLTKKIENGIRDNQKAPSLIKNMANSTFFHSPLPIYHRWNASDCHPEIVINESTNAIQRNETSLKRFPGYCSCRAEPIHMPSAVGRIGIIYVEYRIVAKDGDLLIGLSTKGMPLNDWIGDGRVSYGYANFGMIESRNVNGNQTEIWANVPPFDSSDNGSSFELPSFGTVVVIGCGVNWTTRQVFFTYNGQRLNNTNLYVDEGTADLYPTVSMLDYLEEVEANFGPNFKYDLSKEF